jgi:O-antigen/teichoic acid export membrane protein
MSKLFDNDVVGQFSMAKTLISIPIVLIGTSIGSVFYAEAASLRNSNVKQLLIMSNKILRTLVLIGIIPLLILFFFGPFLFSTFLGKCWYNAGYFARLLSFSIFSNFIFNPISKIYELFEEQKKGFIIDCIKIFCISIVFYSSYIFSMNPKLTIGIYSITTTLLNYMNYYFAQKILISHT